MSEDNFLIKKWGLRVEPPALIIYYRDESTLKTRKRIMPVRKFNKTSNIQSTCEQLRERHEKYLRSIPPIRMEKLLRILQFQLWGHTLQESIAKVQQEFTVNPEEDLNTVDETTLAIKKSVMNETFEINRKKPGDSDFQYDVSVDFLAEGTLEASGWDSNDEF